MNGTECISCSSRKVEERDETTTLEYYWPKATGRCPTPFPVTQTILFCCDCGEEWTDNRAEDQRDEAVKAFLARGAHV